MVGKTLQLFHAYAIFGKSNFLLPILPYIYCTGVCFVSVFFVLLLVRGCCYLILLGKFVCLCLWGWFSMTHLFANYLLVMGCEAGAVARARGWGRRGVVGVTR